MYKRRMRKYSKGEFSYSSIASTFVCKNQKSDLHLTQQQQQCNEIGLMMRVVEELMKEFIEKVSFNHIDWMF